MRTTHKNRRPLRIAAVTAVSVLALAGCSLGGNETAEVDGDSAPVEVPAGADAPVVGETIDGTIESVTYATEIDFTDGTVAVGDLRLELGGYVERAGSRDVFSPWPALVNLETVQDGETIDATSVNVAVLNKTSLVGEEAQAMIDFGFRVAGLGVAESGDAVTREGEERRCLAEVRTGPLGGEEGAPVLSQGIVLIAGSDGTPVAVVVTGVDVDGVNAAVETVLTNACGKG
jgi:hypothetical protein